MNKRILQVLVLLLMVCFVIPMNGSAGPLQSFAESPIPYWVDNSEAVDVSWTSSVQTVTLDDDLGDYDYSSGQYSESFASVTDWVYDSKSAGLPSNTFTSDGDIMTFTIGLDDTGNEWCLWKITGLSVSATGYLRCYFKSDVEGAMQFRLYSGANSAWIPSVIVASTVWQLYSVYIPDYYGYATIDTIKIYVTDLVDATASGDAKVQMDYLYIGPAHLDVRVPIMRQATQSIEFMGDFSGLGSTVRFQFYDNTTASGLYCDVNATHVVFPGDGYTGYDYAVFTDFVRIRFTVNEERRIFKVYAVTKDQSIINYYSNYEGRGNNNYLRMTDAAFDGEFTLWYLQGDTRYLEKVLIPEWDTEGSIQSGVEQSLLTLECDWTGVTDELDHHVTYSVDLPYFGYVRTEWLTDIETNSENADQFDAVVGLNITFADSDYVVVFTVTYHDDNEIVDPQYYYGNVTVLNDTEVLFSSSNQLDGATEMSKDVAAKIMVWRTLENHLGVAMYDEENAFCDDYLGSDWETSTNYSMWISTFAIESWDVVMNYNYDLSSDGFVDGNQEFYFYSTFSMCEYDYWMASGIAQPHFSSIFFELGRGAGQGLSGGTGDVNYVNPDAYDNPPPSDEAIVDAGGPPNIFLDPIGWIWWHINNALAWLGNFIVGGLASIGTFMVDALVAGTLMLAALWNGLLDLISPGLGVAIAGFLGSIPATIGAIGGTLMSGISFLVSLVGMIAFWISWGISWIAHHAELIFWGAIIVVLNTYTVKGFEGVVAIGYFLANIGITIIKGLWGFVLSIINLISGFIPFT